LPGQRWRVRLSEPAEHDFLAILDWTAENFGRRQASVYRRTLIAALGALHEGPDVPGSVLRDEIQPGLRSLHVARRGRCGRHFVVYRAAAGATVEVIRILHDAMDVAANVSSNQ
jgi:toxin ParE1/3/4